MNAYYTDCIDVNSKYADAEVYDCALLIVDIYLRRIVLRRFFSILYGMLFSSTTIGDKVYVLMGFIGLFTC